MLFAVHYAVQANEVPKRTTTSVVGLLILLMGGIRTYLNATVRWTVAATSSKTGGYHNEIESLILCQRIAAIVLQQNNV